MFFLYEKLYLICHLSYIFTEEIISQITTNCSACVSLKLCLMGLKCLHTELVIKCPAAPTQSFVHDFFWRVGWWGGGVDLLETKTCLRDMFTNFKNRCFCFLIFFHHVGWCERNCLFSKTSIDTIDNEFSIYEWHIMQ